MNHIIRYGEQELRYHIVRRDRRTLEISVHPDMSVEVVAPKTASEEAIRARVKKRAAWITRQIQYFRQYCPRTPDRSYVSGETHLYLGRRYRLKLREATDERIRLKTGHIEVESAHPHQPRLVSKLLNAWLQQRAHVIFADRIEVCLQRFPAKHRTPPKALIVRSLTHRWGSLTPAGRLVLNRSLIQASIHEIDYVVTHELCHRIHLHHGRSFFELLTRVMPDWTKRKQSLERRLA